MNSNVMPSLTELQQRQQNVPQQPVQEEMVQQQPDPYQPNPALQQYIDINNAKYNSMLEKAYHAGKEHGAVATQQHMEQNILPQVEEQSYNAGANDAITAQEAKLLNNYVYDKLSSGTLQQDEAVEYLNNPMIDDRLKEAIYQQVQ